MLKKITIGLLSLVGAGLLLLIIINARYPFYAMKGGPWSVGYNTSSNIFKNDPVQGGKVISYQEIDEIISDKIHYIADPFFLRVEDTVYLFVELKGEDNANIALLTSENGKEFEYRGVVLDEDFHLSYPQVFIYKNEYYMLPETKGSNNVLLYNTTNFPYDWKVTDTLLRHRSLKDPSVLLTEGLNLLVGADDDLKQVIFKADSLKGDWSEMELNREKWGNETRPGGRFFNVDGTWYLPVQNRSMGYGTGISLYKLIEDDKHISFEKSFSMFLGPHENQWFNRGMHHLDVQKYDEIYHIAYDGDSNIDGQKRFQYKQSLKLFLMDIYNLF